MTRTMNWHLRTTEQGTVGRMGRCPRGESIWLAKGSSTSLLFWSSGEDLLFRDRDRGGERMGEKVRRGKQRGRVEPKRGRLVTYRRRHCSAPRLHYRGSLYSRRMYARDRGLRTARMGTPMWKDRRPQGSISGNPSLFPFLASEQVPLHRLSTRRELFRTPPAVLCTIVISRVRWTRG